MAKNKGKNIFKSLIAERYLIWAIVYTVTVGAGLWSEIEQAKMEIDQGITSTLYLTHISHAKHK